MCIESPRYLIKWQILGPHHQRFWLSLGWRLVSAWLWAPRGPDAALCSHTLTIFVFSSLKWRPMSAGVVLTNGPRKKVSKVHTVGNEVNGPMFYTWHIFLELGFGIEFKAGGKTTSLSSLWKEPWSWNTHLSSISMGKSRKVMKWEFSVKLLSSGSHRKLS